MKKHPSLFFSISVACLLTSCTVGPDYHRPSVTVPTHFKEASNKNWVQAKPNDLADRNDWWTVFHDPRLNYLESQLNVSNQNIVSAQKQYEQALALVDQARASYYPTLSASGALTRQRAVTVGTNGTPTTSTVTTTHTLGLTASWVPDIWGSVRRTVEANKAGAESSLAAVAAARLSAQSSLAQYYYELRGVDADQKFLDETVAADKKILTLTQVRYKNGTASLADIAQARSQLENAQTLAINNGINRAQYEHAIAVLIGKTPEEFSFAYHPFFGKPPIIPNALPSTLLERRPDIAQAERNMAQANAQIGIAIAAYYPSLSFSPSANVQGYNSSQWLSMPLLNWSVGPSLAETLFDGGLRAANTASARANYEAKVAQYRQTVLAAFQNVEDNLAAVRILQSQAIAQNNATQDARLSLQLTLNQYQSGTVDYVAVSNAQVTAVSAEKAAVDLTTLRMTSTISLITALGGGWENSIVKVG